MGVDSTLIVAFLAILCTHKSLSYPTFLKEIIAMNSNEQHWNQPTEQYYEEEKKQYDKEAADDGKEAADDGKGDMIMYANEWKSDWCKAKPFNHTVRHKGYKDKIVQNKYCYGQCNSIYIPGQNHLESCSSCKPKSYEWVTVTLSSLSSEKKRKHKKIQMIYSCNCIDCPK